MSHSIDWREVIPPAAGGLFLTWVKFFSKFDLKPLAHWSDTPEVVSFLVAGGGLLVATFTLKRKPVLCFLIALIILLVCVLSYLWLSSTPPPAGICRSMTFGQLLLIGAAISYMASALQGYVVSSSSDERDARRADGNNCSTAGPWLVSIAKEWSRSRWLESCDA
jgi:hypothetical protein